MDEDIEGLSTIRDGTAPSRAATLAAGDLIAKRYRIVRLVAAGGMGSVYEAEDLDLRESIALKTLHADLANDARATDRLRREVQLARKVTHRNVCRLFDLGFDRGQTFVTMELLEGITLASCVRRGKMADKIALPIIRQVCAGLAAAHEVGIIHRDLKSENIILTPRRAVIADFGIARGRDTKTDRFAHNVTLAGELLGSPAYMSPEQVDGVDDITQAADIYALGVVMYEMMTGVLPFVGDTNWATASKRLTEDPKPPRALVPSLDPKWEAAILKCLERDPAKRFASALDIPLALAGPARRSKAPLVLAGLGLVALGAGAYVLATRSPAHAVTASAPIGGRRAVAVVPPRGEKWVGLAIADVIAAELAAGEQLRVADAADVARVAGETDPARLAAALAVDDVVTGTISDDALELELYDASGATARIHEHGSLDDVAALADRAGAELRTRLGVPELGPTDRAAFEAVLVHPREAARAYALGRAAQQHGDAQVARDLLVAVVAAVPDHALAHAALANALRELGYEDKAIAEADRAVAAGKALSREDHLVIDAVRAAAAGDWTRAAEVYNALWMFFPDDLRWGLALGDAQSRAGNNKDYAATVAAMRKLRGPQHDDPRIDIAEADLAENLGDFKREAELAHTAIGKLEATAARDLLAQARGQEGWAMLQLGDPDGAVRAFEDTAKIARTAGRRVGVANALVNIANVKRRQGNTDEAAKDYAEALAVFEEVGAKSHMWSVLNGWAILDAGRGDLAGAQDKLERERAICRELGDRVCETLATTNIGVLLQARGHLLDAKQAQDDAIALARALGDKRMIATATAAAGSVLADMGELVQARRDDEQARAMREETGDAVGREESVIALAQLAIDEGNPKDALAPATDAGEALAKLEMWDDVTTAYTTVARAQLALHDVAQAKAAADRAVAAAGKAQDKGIALAARLTSARIARDRAAIVAIRAQADAAGLVGLALEARLALGDPQVAKDANAAGFLQIARRALESRDRR